MSAVKPNGLAAAKSRHAGTKTGPSASPKTGTREWSEHSVNCCRGCSHGCLYCYARERAIRFHAHWLKRGDDWTTELFPPVVDEIYAARTYNERYPGVVMFPTTHDLTPDNADACLAVLDCLLTVKNRVLIVSKPHIEVIDKVLELLGRHPVAAALVEFRFTIGGIDRSVLNFWEPNAPSLPERMACLEMVEAKGYRTSVSAEPLLEPSRAVELVKMVEPFVSGEIWVGKANQLRRRTAWIIKAWAGPGPSPRCPFPIDLDSQIERLEAQQTDEAVMAVVEQLQGNPKIRWKDSYREVIERHSPQRTQRP